MPFALSEKAEQLYGKIKNMPTSALWADTSVGTKKYTNAYELIWNADKQRTLELCGRAFENASDFEKLSEYAKVATEMPENFQRLVFDEEMNVLAAKDMAISEIWQSSAMLIAELGGSLAEIYERNNARAIRAIDLNFELRKLGTARCELGFTAWQESIISSFEGRCPVFLNIEDMSFCRGDSYHAEQAYTAISAGKDIPKEEKEGLVFRLLFELLLKLGERAVLYLEIGENFETAEKMLSYFEARGLLCRTHMAVTPKTSGLGEKLCELCLIDAKKITLDFVLTNEDSPNVICRRLQSLLDFYPPERLRFGGVRGASKLFFASHIYARKAVAKAVSDMGFAEGADERFLVSFFDTSDK